MMKNYFKTEWDVVDAISQEHLWLDRVSMKFGKFKDLPSTKRIYKLKELVEIFGKVSILQICQDKDWEFSEKIIELNKELDRMRVLYHNCDNDSQLFAKGMVEKEKDNIEKVKRVKYRWMVLEDKITGKRPEHEVTDWDLNIIKNLSFEILIGQPQYSDSAKVWYRCPIHNEKTPSFCHYLSSNRYYCFGCHEHGTIIDLYMKIHETNFVDATKNLNQYV